MSTIILGNQGDHARVIVTPPGVTRIIQPAKCTLQIDAYGTLVLDDTDAESRMSAILDAVQAGNAEAAALNAEKMPHLLAAYPPPEPRPGDVGYESPWPVTA